jgi:hypothetical protein
MDIEIAEFLQNKIGTWCVRRIQLYLSSPNADIIHRIYSLQTLCLGADVHEFCNVRTLVDLDRNLTMVINKFDSYIAQKYEYYELCRAMEWPLALPPSLRAWPPSTFSSNILPSTPGEDKEAEKAYDYLRLVKGYDYLNYLKIIGPIYTPINMRLKSKQQLLDTARDMGCIVYKSWNKSKIMQAIYPNLKFC